MKRYRVIFTKQGIVFRSDPLKEATALGIVEHLKTIGVLAEMVEYKQ